MSETRDKILRFVRDSTAKFGYPPSIREIMRHFGFKSPRAVSFHLEKLEAEGRIECHGKARGLRLKKYMPDAAIELPIYGVIPSGPPEKKSEYVLGALAIRPGLIGPGQASHAFALRVEGDSMEGAKIYEGDVAIVEFRPAQNNDIVVAVINGETTIKRLVTDGKHAFLKAENPQYPDLVPVEELSIQGVVIGVYRALQQP